MPGRNVSRVRWTDADRRRLLNLRDNHPNWSWDRIASHFPGRSATGLCKMYSDLKKAERMENDGDEETEEMADQENDNDEATEETIDQANDDDEASVKMKNNEDEWSEEMIDQAHDDEESTEEVVAHPMPDISRKNSQSFMLTDLVDEANDDDAATEASEDQANDDDETTEEAANSQNEGTNTTQLSKENKRPSDLEEDNEAPPRKQTKTVVVPANDIHNPDSNPNPSNGSEPNGGNIKITWEVTLAPHQLPQLPISFAARVERG